MPHGQAPTPDRDPSGERLGWPATPEESYGLAETEDGKLVSVSLWDSAGQAQQANELAASWVRENLAGKVRLEGTPVGDFLFNENA